jgi:hypothetical protein
MCCLRLSVPSFAKLIVLGRLLGAMKAQNQPETLEKYLSLTSPITLYPEPDECYVVMMTDLVGCIRQGIVRRRLFKTIRTMLKDYN